MHAVAQALPVSRDRLLRQALAWDTQHSPEPTLAQCDSMHVTTSSKFDPGAASPGAPASAFATAAASRWGDGSSHSHDIVQAVGWVDHELSNRLVAIDRKLDHLSLQVSGYHASIVTLRNSESEAPDSKVLAEAREHPFAHFQEPLREPWSSNTGKQAPVFNDTKVVNVVHESFAKTKEPDVKPLKRENSKVVKFCNAKENLQPAWAVPAAFEEKALALRKAMDDPENSRFGKWYAILMPGLVVLSVIPNLMQTTDHPPLTVVEHAVLETLIEVIFLVDVLIRFIIARSPRLFILNFNNVIDVLVPLPLILRASYGLVPSFDDLDRMPGSLLLYVVPLLRLLKTLRGFKKFSLVLSVACKVYVETLPTIFMMIYIVLVFATLFFYIEPRDNIESYSMAIWFVCVTMSTVGYGDRTPCTTPGYMLAAVLVVSSVFVMAMPLGIIGTAVSEIWKDRDTIILRKWAKERLDEWGYTAKDIPEFFDAFDSDGSGELDYDEFCAMLAEMKVDIRRDRLHQLFRSFDDDDSGLVDASEFVRKSYPAQFEALFGDKGSAGKNFRKSIVNRTNESEVAAIGLSPPRSPLHQHWTEVESQPLRQAAQDQAQDDKVVEVDA
jgi:voltage-gated potassium channel